MRSACKMNRRGRAIDAWVMLIGLIGASACNTLPTVPLENSGTTTSPDQPPGGPEERATDPPVPPPPVQPPPAFVPPRIDHYVLKNRQKYIGLPTYIKGVEYDACTFTVVTPPTHGQLLGTAPNLCYVPDADFVGYDSLTYDASGGGTSRRWTLYLSVQETYTAPIGIPSPTFGVNETHRMYAGASYLYKTEVGPYKDAGNGPYTHYIDFNTGSDTGNSFGTQASPRRTIPANLPEGSVVEIHGANINGANRYTISGQGSAAKPIFIRGASATNKAVFRRPWSIEGNYIICENIEFDCQDFGLGVTGAVWFWVTSTQHAPFSVFHHIALRHTLFHDQPENDMTNPIAVSVGLVAFDALLDDPALQTENIVVYDTEVRNFSQWDDYSGSLDYGGCLFAPNSRMCWVLDNHWHHVRGDAMSVSRSNGSPNMTPGRNIYIGRNYFHNCKENAIDFKNGVDCIASQNLCHTFRASSSSLGHAIPIHNDDPTPDWPASDNIWVIYNTIFDSEMGIYHENAGSLPAGKQARSFIIGNAIMDVRYIRGNPLLTGVAIQKGELAQSRIINNLIRDCDHGIWMGLPYLTQPDQCTQVVRNNIIVDLTERYFTTTGKHGMHLYLTPNDIVPYTTIDHNLFFESAGSIRVNIVQPGLMDQNYTTVAALAAGTAFGGGSVEGDPLFANAALLDFKLSASSPARGVGVRDEVYDLFPTVFGGSIDYYLDGTPRPSGAMNLGPLP